MNMQEEYGLVYSYVTTAMLLNLCEQNKAQILTISIQFSLEPPNNQSKRLALNLLLFE